MAKTDEKVMALVEDELKKNPQASVDDLYSKAKEVSPAVGKLTRRQFHARYPLQVKRRSQGGAGRKRRARKVRGAVKVRGRRRSAAPAGDVNREAIRDVLIRFATDVAGAEEKKDLIKVMTGVDRYVDQVVKATGR